MMTEIRPGARAGTPPTPVVGGGATRKKVTGLICGTGAHAKPGQSDAAHSATGRGAGEKKKKRKKKNKKKKSEKKGKKKNRKKKKKKKKKLSDRAWPRSETACTKGQHPAGGGVRLAA